MSKSTGLLLAACIGLVAFVSHTRQPAHAHNCEAIDGDTLVCDGGLRLRLNGIDAPELPGHCRAGRRCEPGDPFASQATLQNAIGSGELRYRALRVDYYGRTVAEVTTVDGLDLSCVQLQVRSATYRADWDEKGLVSRCG